MKRQIFLICPFLALAGTHVARADEAPPYAAYYDPAKGFKPASADITADFLQLAASLEACGSPEPFIRHVLAECARIDAKYQKATGKAVSSKPAYLTEEYVSNLIEGWKKLETPLKLEVLSRDSGRNMRYAILGGWNKSIAEKVKDETKLTAAEAETYRSLLEMPYFKESSFPELDAFYQGPRDRLTEAGKRELSRRVWMGMKSPDERDKILNRPHGGSALVALFTAHQDATVAFLEGRSACKANSDTLEASLVSGLKLEAASGDWDELPAHDGDPLIYSHAIRAAFQLRIQAVKKQTDAENAGKIEIALKSMPENLLVLVYSEYIAGITEKLNSNPSAPK